MTALVLVALLVTVAGAIRSTWSPCGLSMLTSINPIAERGRGHRYSITATWFLLGSLAGGATLGAGIALFALGIDVTGVPLSSRLVLGALGALVAVLLDTGLLGIELPILRRQVNERWLDERRGWFYGVGFGWQIGVGFATYVMTGAVLLVVLLGSLSASATIGLGLGVVFGLVRGVAVLLSANASSQEALRSLLRRLDALEEPIRRVVMVIEIAAAGFLALRVSIWLAVGVVILGAVALGIGLRRAPVVSKGA